MSGAVSDLEYVRPIDERDHCLCPMIPAPNRNYSRNKVISPSEGVIEMMEEKTHEALDDFHDK